MTRQLFLTSLLWTLPLAVNAEIYELPPDGSDVIGGVSTILARHDDTLLDIARRHGLGYEDIVRANPDVDVWLPGEGTEVVLPTRYIIPSGPRRGVVLNLAEYRMYYFPEPAAGERAVVMTYPMSIGRMDWATPLGRTRVVAKVRNPAWYPPESVRAEHAAEGDILPRVVPPGPKNPLGARAMRLDIPGYLIHGTNRPDGVGMRVTHGCIRMFPEDIEFLFEQVPVNTPVRIVNEPIKLGWDGENLVMEAHRQLESSPIIDEDNMSPVVRETAETAETVAASDATVLTEADAVEDASRPVLRDPLTLVTEQFVAATSERAGELDWNEAERLVARASGMPMPVGRAIKNAATSAASE
ncbi:MAG: L,D-transpeptidase family protein [Gammaproteobacteria bacterium]|nr:L,D-transpeptidase family protein [Gammaproteobacteria bacterium]MDH4256187.1 L,D-transpeptidase family protein [Gammaproteobacteria bacterium]MDH5311521.1 L,D-transpeptidase family protein [Gammaproteobacteria bacterium]